MTVSIDILLSYKILISKKNALSVSTSAYLYKWINNFAYNFTISDRIVRRPRSARPPKRFGANHPFLYLLTAHDVPLFIGVYEGREFAQTSELLPETDRTVPIIKRIKRDASN